MPASTYTDRHRRYYNAHAETIRAKQRERAAVYWATHKDAILAARKARRQALRLTHL